MLFLGSKSRGRILTCNAFEKPAVSVYGMLIVVSSWNKQKFSGTGFDVEEKIYYKVLSTAASVVLVHEGLILTLHVLYRLCHDTSIGF